jgi:hypothetical protein
VGEQPPRGRSDAATPSPVRRCRSKWPVLALTSCALAFVAVVYTQDIRDLGHWPLKRLRARLASWTWPSDPFDEAVWERSPPESRFRLLNDLLKSERLSGLDADGVAHLLGGRPQETMLFRLKPAGDNLWYILLVKCPRGRACEAEVGMAYIDPT